MTIDLRIQRYALMALGAAALFGASTPFAKLLLESTTPLVLAGLLYLGSGVALATLFVVGRSFGIAAAFNRESLPRGQDLRWLAGAVLAGGVIAPGLMMWGLARTGASTASLLLNFEGLLTTLIAAIAFREAISPRIWLATVVMLCGATVLAFGGDAAAVGPSGMLAILGACGAWALDNNLTRRISGSSPVVTALLKGLVAGTVMLTFALSTGGQLPQVGPSFGALVVGAFGYGFSLVLFIYALRHLGSARTVAHFSTAPFVGAGVSIVLLGEVPTVGFMVACVLMVVATWLALTEQHEHEHSHQPLEHEHLHVHDEHHQHAHRGDEGPEPHSHHHRHEPLTHRHPHLPDLHHRHPH